MDASQVFIETLRFAGGHRCPQWLQYPATIPLSNSCGNQPELADGRACLVGRMGPTLKALRGSLANQQRLAARGSGTKS